jgi:hypothetical protein
MKNWFKKIETETHDVLIKRSSENGSENVEVTIMTALCEVTKTLGCGEDSSKADRAFKEIDKEYCIKFINAVEQTFSDLNINQPDEEADEN